MEADLESDDDDDDDDGSWMKCNVNHLNVITVSGIHSKFNVYVLLPLFYMRAS